MHTGWQSCESGRSWIPLSKGFSKATGLPGYPKGYMTILRGYSDTGKSTGIYEGVAGCQKLNIMPVIIDTENAWDWEHAKDVGVQFEPVANKDTGEIMSYKGNFIYVNNDVLITKYGTFDYDENKDKKEKRNEAVIEDVARYINEMLDMQSNGDFPMELCFLWDSVGTLDCYQGYSSKSRNNQWNAGALARSFMSILNYKIPSSRKEGKPYTNTFVCVNKVWMNNKTESLQNKGGESFWSACRLQIHFGGVIAHGTTPVFAETTIDGVKKRYDYGVKGHIKVVKNHVNGVTYEGTVISTAHGFVSEEDKPEYINEHRKFFLDKLGALDDAIIEFKEDDSKSDIEL